MKRTWRNQLFSAWDLFWISLDSFASTAASRLSLWWQGCPAGHGLRTSGKAYFKARRSGSIQLGREVTLLAGHRSNRVGLATPTLLETLGEGNIEIGNFSGGSSVVISSRSCVKIGQYVKLGGNVRIFDHDFHSLDPEIRRSGQDKENAKTAPVTLGDDVFVGTNALILKGVTIGDRAIVAAGSVVTQDIPADEIWGGNPAVMLRAKKQTSLGA